MGLINLQTNLKSLKFGNDRPGGGSSGQPFIKKPLFTDITDRIGPSNTDFLLRGGIQAPLRAAEDVVRLTKYMFDRKNPSGLFFIAKQNLLSRISVKTESSRGLAYLGGIINAGVYTPLSTLAQAGVGFTGTHLIKQGLDPSGLLGPLSIKKYEDTIKKQNVDNFLDSNRLVGLTNAIFGVRNYGPNPGQNLDIISDSKSINNFNFQLGYSLNKGNSVIEFGGGPGSLLGIGKTRIRFSDQRTGINNPNFNLDWPFNYARVPYNLYSIFEGIGLNGSVSRFYSELTGVSLDSLLGNDYLQNFNNKTVLPQDLTSVYNPGFGNRREFTGLGSWEQKDFIDQPNSVESKIVGSYTNAKILTDFREKLDPTNSPQNTFLAISPNYDINAFGDESKNIEIRVNLGDPGKRGNISNYILGKRDPETGKEREALDTINAHPIYKSDVQTSNWKIKNDLCKFRFAIFDVDNPSQKYYVHFRAYINSFSEGYKSTWNGQKYMGRGEELYKYNGFGRDISISFTVAAQSKRELYPMYKKLNYLASSLAPAYTKAGYMAGNLCTMTLGGYLFEQPGFIESVDYEIPQDSPWEIGINLKDLATNGKFEENKVKELPHYINVTLKFKPIHRFRPAITKITTPNGPQHADGANYTLADQNTYGQERYISIADGFGEDRFGVHREGYDSGKQTRAEYEADLSNTGAPNPTNLSGNPTLPIKPLSPVAQNQVTPTILPMSAPQQTPESIAASDTSRRPLRGRVRGFFNNLFYRVQ